MANMDLEDIAINSSPFDAGFFLKGIESRSIFRVVTEDDDFYGIVTAMHIDPEDSSRSILLADVTDLVEGNRGPNGLPDLGNILVRTKDIIAIDVSDESLLTMPWDKRDVTKLFNRTKRIVQEAEMYRAAAKERGKGTAGSSTSKPSFTPREDDKA